MYNKESKLSRIFLLWVPLVLFLLFLLFPFYWTLVTSLKDTHELHSLVVTYWPVNPTGAAYEHLFTQFNFLHPMKNSFIVAAITTRHKKLQMPTHVPILASECGIRHDSVVLMEQVRTVEKTRLTKYLGTAPPETMRRVDAALRLSLGTECTADYGGNIDGKCKEDD